MYKVSLLGLRYFFALLIVNSPVSPLIRPAEEPLHGQTRSARRKPSPRKRLVLAASVGAVVVLVAEVAAGPAMLKVRVVMIRVKMRVVLAMVRKRHRIPKEERQILQSHNDCRSCKMRRN